MSVSSPCPGSSDRVSVSRSICLPYRYLSGHTRQMFPQSVLVSGRMRQIVFVGQYLVAVPVAQDTACASWTRLAQPPALDSHARGPKTVSGGGRRGGGACVGGGPERSPRREHLQHARDGAGVRGGPGQALRRHPNLQEAGPP